MENHHGPFIYGEDEKQESDDTDKLVPEYFNPPYPEQQDRLSTPGKIGFPGFQHQYEGGENQEYTFNPPYPELKNKDEILDYIIEKEGKFTQQELEQLSQMLGGYEEDHHHGVSLPESDEDEEGQESSSVSSIDFEEINMYQVKQGCDTGQQYKIVLVKKSKEIRMCLPSSNPHLKITSQRPDNRRAIIKIGKKPKQQNCQILLLNPFSREQCFVLHKKTIAIHFSCIKKVAAEARELKEITWLVFCNASHKPKRCSACLEYF